jgi:hypothetical protein
MAIAIHPSPWESSATGRVCVQMGEAVCA